MRDIRKLTNAAKKIGNGEPVLRLRINREDEIGQLARTFNEMEHNLRIDKLTAVFNRESLLAQIRFLKRRPNQGPLEKDPVCAAVHRPGRVQGHQRPLRS
ncbi:HAMP domain-containing protein [Undibacterium arcticum]